MASPVVSGPFTRGLSTVLKGSSQPVAKTGSWSSDQALTTSSFGISPSGMLGWHGVAVLGCQPNSRTDELLPSNFSKST